MDTKAIAQLLHSYNAFIFFDYAASAPYVPINMNPRGCSYDAIFISSHKLIGGPGSPGILALKRDLLTNDMPAQPGGGTVFFVTELDHNYLINPEEREEGGTPNIVGAVRAGIVFQLKAAVGDELVFHIEEQFYKKIAARLRQMPNLALAADSPAKKIPIFSFIIKCGHKFFHYSYIAALYNDLFGIQLRGGCACAGPYALNLMGISKKMSHEIRDVIAKGFDLFRPGMVRFNMTYFYGDDMAEYLLDATAFIAEHAVWFLPMYKFDMERSAFLHRDFSTKEGRHRVRKWLGDIRYDSGQMVYPDYNHESVSDFSTYLQDAHTQLA